MVRTARALEPVQAVNLLRDLDGLIVPSEQFGDLHLHHLAASEVEKVGDFGADTPQGRRIETAQPSKKEL